MKSLRTFMMRAAMTLLLAVTATATWADEFLTDVMVIGGSGTVVSNLKASLSAQGWTVIDQDLNAKADGDYIYLLYKSESNTDGVNYGYITDFYISNEKGIAPDTRTVNGRTYYLVPYDGSDYFTDVERKGDLNSNAGGDYIHLYYTRDFFTDNRAVKGITFNSTQRGAVGVNGGTTGYDLNSGAGGDYIYMHVTTGTAVAPFSGSGTAASPFLISSTVDWKRFATCVSKGLNVDMYYKLTADISVTEMVGTSEHPFAGHFDGNGQTLTVNINSTAQYAAPFSYADGATIHDLTVAGTVSGSQYAGGIVGYAAGTLTLQNCVCSAAISGFKKYAGGLLGWCEDLTLTMTNCLFKGTFSPASGGKYHPIACKDAGKTVTATVTGTYYLNSITPTATGDNIIPGAEGKPVSATCITDSWDLPVTAADGITYYLLFTGKRLPYEYGFENNNLEAEGWTMVDCYDNNVDRTKICNSENGYLHSGDYAFHFDWSAFEPQVQYLVSPEFNGHSPILVRFYYKTLAYPTSSQVGYSTTTPDIDAFTWGETNTSSTRQIWELYEASFPKGTKYIAIKSIPNDYGYLYIDDFSFTVSDTPSPTHLSAIDVTEYTASPSWEAPAADYPITGYAYQYKKASDEVWSAEVTVPPTTTSVTLNGLSADTDYQFRVKALYGELGESFWISTPFTTAMELPYECGFENGMEHWSMVDCYRGSETHTGVSSDAARDGENGFKFESWGTVPQYLISPRFVGTSEMTVSFYYRDRKPDSGFWETFQVGYSTTTNDISDFTWSNDIYATNILWTLYEHTFPVGTRFIAIKFISTKTIGIFIDDFSFVVYSSYAKPTGLAVSDLTDHSAKFTWKRLNGARGYAYQYKKPTENAWSTEATTTATSITLSSLDANTSYQFRVKALYDGGNASNYVTTSFLTEASAVSLPYYQDFENGMGGWRIVNGNYSMGLYSNNGDFIHNGNNSFRFVSDEMIGTSQYLISPQLNSSSEMQVSFYYKNYKDNTYNFSATLQVGYSTTTKDLDAFTWDIQVGTNSGEWKEYRSYYPAGTKYVAVRRYAGYFLYVDDFSFTESVFPPAPHDLAVTDITSTSAEISWKGNADKYLVHYRTERFFYDDFENGFGQWKVINQGGNAKTDWHVEYDEEQDYHFAVSKTYDNEAKKGYAVDNWLISPQVTLNGFLKFWTAQNLDFPVYYEVLVSTTTDDINEFVKVAAPGPPANDNEWEMVTIDLSSYHGQKGYIAFRLKDEDKDWLGIDDVSICLDDHAWKYMFVTGENAEVTGLLPLTTYECQVSGVYGNYYTEWTDMATFTTNRIAPLYDDDDNTELINGMAAYTDRTFDVMLVRRPLYKDGTWNTLCLPFGVSNLSGTPLDGATLKTLGSTDLSDDGTLTLNFTDATGIEAGKPYVLKWDLSTPDLIIRSAADWEAFAQNVNNGTESYEGKLVQLGTDISISTMAGTADHPFCGTFDGAGYTLNVSISGAEYAAPFRYISGATIRNLKVTGSVNGGQYSAGIVGAALGGTNSIRDCWMAASVTGQSNVGGILGHGTTSATTISNCYLNGSLNASYIGVLYGGGSNDGTHTVENCWAGGSYPSIIIGGDINLVLTDGGKVSVTNCYQNVSETAQGTYYEFLVVGEGSIDTYYADFLGGQWTLDDNGGLALKHTTDVASITSPVFYRVRVINTITPVETDHVNFIGITSPATLAADDSSLLYLDTDNTLHHPDADMTLNACRGYFQLSDPNATVNAIVLNFDGVEILLGDVNGDGTVSPADAIMILYHYFNVEQNGFNAAAADMNGDSNITPADAIEALYKFFNSGQSHAPQRGQLEREPQ